MATWIYGAGGFAKRLRISLENQGVSISGLLTQADLDKSFIVNSKDIFYLGIFNHIDDPNKIIDYLKSKGVEQLVTPSQAIKEAHNNELDTYYLCSSRNNLCTEEEVLEILGLLQDSQSKQVLSGFYDYQKNGNIENLIRSAGHEKQYLGTLLSGSDSARWLVDNIRWIDCGAYIGDTVEAVRNVCESGQVIFLNLEPDPENYKKLNSLTALQKINAINLKAGCGDKNRMAKMSKSTGLSSQISKDSNESDSSIDIPIFTLDEIAGSWLPTHIKMDIEGSEMEAIQGAKRIIQTYMPKLAIAVYHKPKDIYEIPKYISGLAPDYRFYLRTYGAHGYDTVLYAIPKEIN
jgi:FkbM family methyltransferase